jgi:hypothetical protein
LERTFEEQVPEQYRNFKDIFEKSSFDKLPESRKWDHAIDMKPDWKPKMAKIYPLSLNQQKELDVFLEENLKSSQIIVSKSPQASPFFFVKKKDGKLQPVQDYRELNKDTIPNATTLPLMSKVVHRLRKAKVFTALDVHWGFNNIRIKRGDKWKAAFLTNQGLFEPQVMFFGLTNSPATFQTMMNKLFRELIAEGHIIVFMDDIIIFTEDLDEHC